MGDEKQQNSPDSNRPSIQKPCLLQIQKIMALHHTRSHSFPSGSKPVIIQVDEKKLLSESTPSSLSSVTNRLTGLKILYGSVDDLLLLPHIRRIISQECREKWVDDILDGHITLLDACATARDLMSCAKRDAQQLCSTLRRKREDTDDLHFYLISTRKFKKMVQDCLRTSKITNKRKFRVLEKEYETRPIVQMLTEAKSATLAMLDFLLSYVMGIKAQSMQRSWSPVSKLMHLKGSSHGEQTESSEFNQVETALLSFVNSKTNKENDIKVDDLLNHLKKMESSIQILEEGLECLYRRLIKTRVLLLNILSQ